MGVLSIPIAAGNEVVRGHLRLLLCQNHRVHFVPAGQV